MQSRSTNRLILRPLTHTLRLSAGDRGGGIYNGIGTLTVTNSTFTGNRAEAGSGGGIANIPTCLRCGMLTIINSTFTGNSASDLGSDVASYYVEGPLAPAVIRNTIFAHSLSGEIAWVPLPMAATTSTRARAAASARRMAP